MILPFAGLKARTEPAKTVAFIVVWFPATNSLLLVESQIGAARQRSGGYTLGLDYIDLQRLAASHWKRADSNGIAYSTRKSSTGDTRTIWHYIDRHGIIDRNADCKH